MGTEIDSAVAKSRYLAALRDLSPVERGRHKVLVHQSPEQEEQQQQQHLSQTMASSSASAASVAALRQAPPPPPPPRVAAGAQSVVSKWADRSRESSNHTHNNNQATTTSATSTTAGGGVGGDNVDSTSDFFIPVESTPPPPPPPAPRSSSNNSKSTATSPTSQSTLSAWKQRQMGRNSTTTTLSSIPPPISSASPKQPRVVHKHTSKHTSSIPSPNASSPSSSSSSLQNQPWVKKRNLSVSTTTATAETGAAAASSSFSTTTTTTTTDQPPPQLAYQKSQWDAQRDIPRGLVAQKVAGQQQKLKEVQDTTFKPRISSASSTTSSTTSSNAAFAGSNLARYLPGGNHAMSRMGQPTPEGLSSSSTASSSSTPNLPSLDDATLVVGPPVQPPPSPRHARQLSPNYNNGSSSATNKEKDERMWGASSTSPRLAASAAVAAAGKSSSSPRQQHQQHAKSNTISSPRHSVATNRTSPRHAITHHHKTTSPRHAVVTHKISSPRHAVVRNTKNNNAFADPFPITSSRYSLASNNHNNNNTNSQSTTAATVRQPAGPFPRTAVTAKAATTPLEWNPPGFGAPPPPPPLPNEESDHSSPDFEFHKEFLEPALPTSPNADAASWQPNKVASPKGRLANNFFVQADPNSRRDGAAQLEGGGLDAAPRMFWGDESLDEEQDGGVGEVFPFQSSSQEPEPVKSPSMGDPHVRITTTNDPFTDLRSSSTNANTTNTTTTQTARGGSRSTWPTSSSAPPTAQTTTSTSWPTSRFMGDEVDWFEKGHVFSTDTNESESLQNSVAEQKALLGGKRSSSTANAYTALDDLDEKKMDDATTTTTSPRSLGSPEELASMAPRKSKTFPPEGTTPRQSPPSTKSVGGGGAKTAATSSSPTKLTSPTNNSNKGWLMTSNSADSGSKSVSSSNATTSVEDDVSAPMNGAAHTKETKKSRFGILNIFGTGKNKKKDSNSSVNSKGGKSVGAESVTSKSQVTETPRVTPRASSRDQASIAGGSYTKPSPELIQSKSHEASSFTNVPYHGSLTYNQSEGDDTTISEMTNPTVFQSNKKELDPPLLPAAASGDEEDFHQASTPKTQLRHERPSVTTSPPPAGEIDPFDVNSPVFASGDPFGMFGVKHQSKESFSVSDPFFDAAGDVDENEPTFINPEITELNVPDPPLEHVELESSDDEDEVAGKISESKQESRTKDISVVASVTQPEQREASVSSDPLLPTSAEPKPTMVSSSKFDPDISGTKSVATARAMARLRSGAKMANTTKQMAPTADQLLTDRPVEKTVDRNVPTVAPRYFASVAKSRKRGGLASSSSLPDQSKPVAPSTLTVSSDFVPAKTGPDSIPTSVDVSKSKKSPKSATTGVATAPTDGNDGDESFKSAPDSILQAPDETLVSPEATGDSLSVGVKSVPESSKVNLPLGIQKSKSDIGKSPAVARSIREEQDQGWLSAVSNSVDTREPDSVESARSGVNSSVLLMRRRNEKRRQLKEESIARQQALLMKQKAQNEKMSSPYLVKFNQRKSTPSTKTSTPAVTTSDAPDTSALLPAPPAIERIHADFDREINKMLPTASSSEPVSSRIQAKVSKDVERKKNAAPVPEDGSISSSASSYRSRKPRSILRKTRRGLPEIAPQTSGDINDIVDPMHRAGLRLLAAAIIPIQSAARRFLAKREAVSRLWAIVIIQAYFRRWLAELAMSQHFATIEIQACFRRWIAQRHFNKYRSAVSVQTCFRRWTAGRWFKQYKAAKSIQKSYRCWSARSSFQRQVHAAISIQTLFRGWFARDCLLYKHYSAMQIQRMARGYLATIYVYEYIYKVTIVQSCFRRKKAIDDAAYRLSFIMQLQSIVRGYLARRNLVLANKKATTIQSAWRCYYGRMSFRFDLIDIIIAQNCWRRTLAKRLASDLRNDRKVRSAIKIQAQWRSYDCTMNYLHYLADVLIVQSAVRRWSARRYVASIRFSNAVMIQKATRSFLVRNRTKKESAAVAIQRTWRGFVCYADYMFTVADIVIVQTRVRSLLAKREASSRRYTRDYSAAVEIQRRWRGYADYQRALVTQADIIICQSTARRYLALKRFRRLVRVHEAATRIQSVWRGYTCSRDFLREVSARVIARSWRLHVLQRGAQKQRAATCIARSWKLYLFRSERDIASVVIQKYWRRFVKETEYFIMKFEYQAATTIQSAWRRFWNFSNFVIMLDSSIRLQSRWRSYREHSRFTAMKQAATTIQTTSRSFIARKRVDRMTTADAMVEGSRAIALEESIAVTRLQSVIRGRRIRLAVRLYLSARKLQSWIRGTYARHAVKLYLCARTIQCRFRGARVRVAVHLYLCARRIQAKWRGYRLRHPYLHFISARRIQTAWRCTNARHAYTRYIATRRIQTSWRSSKARRDYTILRGEILAATLIQAAWRGFLCYTDYIFTVADVIAAQRVARMYLARKQFLALRDDRDREIAAVQVQRYWRGFLGRHSAYFERVLHEREIQQHDSAIQIQRVWRGYDQKQIYWYVLGCAIQIQRFARGRLVRERMKAETYAATTVQALARRYFCRQEHHKRMLETMLIAVATEEAKSRIAAVKVQEWWAMIREKDRRNTAAIVIQRFFLMVKAEVDREIQAEKKRRKMRKKLKNRTAQDDDDILERVWMSTISQDETETNVVQYAVTTAAIELGRARTPGGRSSSAPRSSQHGEMPDTGCDDDVMSWSENPKQGNHFQFNQSSPRKMQERSTLQAKLGLRTPVRKKHLLPPTYTNGDVPSAAYNASEQQLPETVRLRPGSAKHALRGEDDAASEVSGLTTGSSVYRVPPSRLETLSRKEMDEDFSLEEAWIDAEIRNVKERKRTENRENTPIDYVYPFPSPGKRGTSSVQRTPLSRDSQGVATKSSRRPKQST